MKVVKDLLSVSIKIILGVFLYAFIVTIWWEVSVAIPSKIGFEKTSKYVYAITRYPLPDSAKLIYSKRYWSQGLEAMTVCSVFELSSKDISALEKQTLSRGSNYDYDAVLPDRGCAHYRSTIVGKNLFKKEAVSGDHLRGYILYIDKSNELAMLEMYLYD